MLCSTMNREAPPWMETSPAVFLTTWKDVEWKLHGTHQLTRSHYNQSESISCWHKLLSTRGWGVILSPFFFRGYEWGLEEFRLLCQDHLVWIDALLDLLSIQSPFTRHKSMRFSHQRKKFTFWLFWIFKKNTTHSKDLSRNLLITTHKVLLSFCILPKWT